MQEGMQVSKAALDKHGIMKQELFEEFQLKYSHLVRFVATMPLPHAMKMNGFARADEFYFWIREAIANIRFVQEAPPAPTPPPEVPPAPECAPEAKVEVENLSEAAPVE